MPPAERCHSERRVRFSGHVTTSIRNTHTTRQRPTPAVNTHQLSTTYPSSLEPTSSWTTTFSISGSGHLCIRLSITISSTFSSAVEPLFHLPFPTTSVRLRAGTTLGNTRRNSILTTQPSLSTSLIPAASSRAAWTFTFAAVRDYIIALPSQLGRTPFCSTVSCAKTPLSPFRPHEI